MGHTTEALFKQSSHPDSDRLIVFFPGDLSDFPYAKFRDPLAMGYPECMNYNYTLDYIMRDLSTTSSGRTSLLMFRPEIMRGNFACYNDYVLSDVCGNPLWEDRSRQPSRSFLSYVEKAAVQMGIPSQTLSNITLVGFSKGAVVLNALLRDRDPNLLHRIKKLIYIDPGLSQPGLFPFSTQDYDCFPSEIPIQIYVTPYQMKDPNRPWLQREITEFAANTGATLRHILCEAERSLETHFKSITVAMLESNRNSY